MKYIGIIVAMEEEHEAVQNIMTDIDVKQISNLRFIEGKIEGKNCVLVQCGVGKVNAARTTQIMIDNFEIEYVANLGSAGAINENLKIGDVIVGKHVVQHDFDITAFGHSKGYISGVGDKIYCDANLVNQFAKKMEEMPERDYNYKLGIVATGDIFCTDVTMKNDIIATFDADIVDMECAAIAQVCYLDEIPFIVIRSVSDVPNGDNASTFDENLKLASARSAEVFKWGQGF